MKVLILALLAVLSVAMAAMAADKTVTVTIHDMMFDPPLVTVTKGTTVIWVNHDDGIHSVVQVDKRYRSASMERGDSVKRTFGDVGQFDYVCGQHPQMDGKIIVTP